MKFLSTCIFIICLLSKTNNAQPAIAWQNTIGGSDRDDLYSLIQTFDGGYFLAGISKSDSSGDKAENNIGSTANFDFWTIKTDSIGNILWQNTIGGFGSDYLKCVQQVHDGGFILGGYSNSDSSGDKHEDNFDLTNLTYDYWIVKLSPLGVIEWENTIGGTGDDKVLGIEETKDNGFIITGWSDSPLSGDKTEDSIGGLDCWIVKLNSMGAITMQNTIGGFADDKLFSIHEVSNGYLLGGSSTSDSSGDKMENSKGGYDYWILRLDTSGNIIWQKTIGGSADDFLRTITLTFDSAYFIAGYSNSGMTGDKTENNIGGFDLWAIKTDTSGMIIWQNSIGGLGDELCSFGLQSNDNNYFLGGSSNSDSSLDKSENSWGGYDYWVVSLDQNGIIQWENTIGGQGWDILNGSIQTNDGGYILGGYSGSDISGDKTEANWGLAYDYWIIKLSGLSVNIQNHTRLNSISIFPNPASEVLHINSRTGEKFFIRIIDTMGQELFTSSFVHYELQIPIHHLSKGMYFLLIWSGDETVTKRFIKD